MSRFTRQIRLAEVGEAGQARLNAARVATTNVIEAAYLRAAGLTVVEGTEPHRDAPDLGIRHATARAVADGAFAALVVMRDVLGVGS